MNKHLQLVRAFHDACEFPQAVQGANSSLSDMDIIKCQAMLMEQASELLKALKEGELTDILLSLVDLAYYALAAIAIQGADVKDQPLSWQHDGLLISIMRLISDNINRCASGNTDAYAQVYALCLQLAKRFLNADFDHAFQTVHDSHMERLEQSGKCIYKDIEQIRKAKLLNEPDLSESLYE